MDEIASNVKMCLYTLVDGIKTIVEVYSFVINPSKKKTQLQAAGEKAMKKKSKHQLLLEAVHQMFDQMDDRMKMVN